MSVRWSSRLFPNEFQKRHPGRGNNPSSAAGSRQHQAGYRLHARGALQPPFEFGMMGCWGPARTTSMGPGIGDSLHGAGTGWGPSRVTPASQSLRTKAVGPATRRETGEGEQSGFRTLRRRARDGQGTCVLFSWYSDRCTRANTALSRLVRPDECAAHGTQGLLPSCLLRRVGCARYHRTCMDGRPSRIGRCHRLPLHVRSCIVKSTQPSGNVGEKGAGRYLHVWPSAKPLAARRALDWGASAPPVRCFFGGSV